MRTAVILEAPWREPAEVLGALGERPWALGLLTGGADGGWSYVAAEPAATRILAADDPEDPIAALAALAGPAAPADPSGPPFQGGVAGLLSYDLADRFEPLGLPRHDGWPDLACARYDALLAFDHAGRRVLAVGRGEAGPAATARARAALAWLELAPHPAGRLDVALEADCPAAYEAAVAQTVARIAAGEIFQANIARRWVGRLKPGGRPVDLVQQLAATSPAPFAAYLRLPDRAVVCNSPERFLKVTRQGEALLAETQPIKGTAPRGGTPAEDAALAGALAASAKDRAENLMIVDLMRNDLSRVCAAGAVTTPELFRLASFANVHHLVSTVRGRLAPGAGALDLLRAAFPPGSITGAPKVQAMKLIRELEGARGPFFGAMFWLGCDGTLDSNVLIRTVGFVQDAEGWRLEARAGAGIVADSR
ncbi:MAG: para-aminobenzoate synthase, component, partial [Phenylobacterium sp.]|nr:para-aminobenzoate synthase, component [Phenylobacterium sp.]